MGGLPLRQTRSQFDDLVTCRVPRTRCVDLIYLSDEKALSRKINRGPPRLESLGSRTPRSGAISQLRRIAIERRQLRKAAQQLRLGSGGPNLGASGPERRR